MAQPRRVYDVTDVDGNKISVNAALIQQLTLQSTEGGFRLSLSFEGSGVTLGPFFH